MSYILDELIEAGVREVVFIVGYLGDVIRDFIEAEYPELEAHYVVQEVWDGTAGAVKLAEPWADDDLLILFVDTIFDADLSLVKSLGREYAGVIWAKEVEDYQRFGVIITRSDLTMERIVEKPKTPVSKLANIGLYYIRDSSLLFEALNDTLGRASRPSGEYFLTDAFQYMVDHGAQLLIAPVEGWYDCGNPDTLLATNRHLLESGRGGVAPEASVVDAELVEPVLIEEGVQVRGGRIGPNVTVGRGSRITDSILCDVIVGEGSTVEGSVLRDSLLGSWVQVRGVNGQLSVADHSEVFGDS
jgi:glucose-1-phosphate thymidylyltransferase